MIGRAGKACAVAARDMARSAVAPASIFGFAVSRHIDLEDAQTIIAAIKETPEDMPIDLVIHTPGGIVLAAMQIARAVEAHKAKVTVYVPVYARGQ